MPFYRGFLVPPACEGCPFQGAAQVPPEGDTEAAVAIVGEGPGHEEEQLGRPFVGASGRILDELLARQGRDRASVWITNATYCRPRSVYVTTSDGRRAVIDQDKAKWMAATHCRPRLLAELVRVNPRVVVAVGGIALTSLRGKRDSILARRGAVHQVDVHAALAALAAPSAHKAGPAEGGQFSLVEPVMEFQAPPPEPGTPQARFAAILAGIESRRQGNGT